MKDFDIPDIDPAWLTSTLTALGYTYDHAEPLRVEASHRRFYRIHTPTQPLILMLSPPALEANDRFVNLAEAFAAAGVGVPRILARAPDNDCFVMTDLGQTHLADVYDTAAESAAVEKAIDQLAVIAPVQHPDIELYTTDRLQMELNIFEEWFAQEYLSGAGPVALANQQQLIDAIQLQPKCCAHRDYHSRNLLCADDRLGVVDFQDALHGPLLYDVASLLRDCYHVFSEEKIERWLKRFLGLPHAQTFAQQHAFQEIQRMFDFTALQRQLKAIGIFARLSLRDDKHAHLPHIEPNLARAAALAGQYPELRPLHTQLNDCITEYGAEDKGDRSL